MHSEADAVPIKPRIEMMFPMLMWDVSPLEDTVQVTLSNLNQHNPVDQEPYSQFLFRVLESSQGYGDLLGLELYSDTLDFTTPRFPVSLQAVHSVNVKLVTPAYPNLPSQQRSYDHTLVLHVPESSMGFAAGCSYPESPSGHSLGMFYVRVVTL